MDNLALERLINEANLLLVSAEDELKKPQVEMMSLAVCQNAKLSMLMLLRAYLVKHKVEFSENANLVELYEKCRAYNPAFNTIDIQEMGCVDGTHCSMEEYCMHTNYVTDCVSKAKRIRTLLYQP
jgi:hypothetical protein